MTFLPGTAGERTAPVRGYPTLGWLAKRSALLLAILAAGIGAACLLYTLAGDSAPVQAAKPPLAAETAAPKG